MQEKIGNIILDYEYAPEEAPDHEEPLLELLKIAEQYSEKELNQVIADRNSYPVLFHFSHLRQNLLEWLPIRKEDKVLEIGSDCGALTGALSGKAGSVTCVEASKARCIINANRNRDCSNVKILVGNFGDIEKNLKEKYDYITLVGVLEYAGKYIGDRAKTAVGSDVFAELLEMASDHLAPGGRLVIAIDNRLGLKYWAGCVEDHTGKLFQGLEGYPDTTEVKTFSRKELKNLIEAAGNFRTEFYYPYPDFRFPMSIYSDDYLPKKGELHDNFNNYDSPRMQLFSEPRVYDSLLEAGLFQEFSNSFLVLAERMAD